MYHKLPKSEFQIISIYIYSINYSFFFHRPRFLAKYFKRIYVAILYFLFSANLILPTTFPTFFFESLGTEQAWMIKEKNVWEIFPSVTFKIGEKICTCKHTVPVYLGVIAGEDIRKLHFKSFWNTFRDFFFFFTSMIIFKWV